MNKLNLKRFCLMVDCSRNAVLSVPEIKRWVDRCLRLGYNALMIYMEDTYEISDNIYFGYGRGRYSKAELKEIDAYGQANGVEIIPFVQTLAHIEQIFRWRDYSDLCDIDDILLTDCDATYRLIEGMFDTLAECFTTRTVNVGMDEAKRIGRGRYYDLHGDARHLDLLLKHTERVARIAAKHGFEILMWSDMFFTLASGSDSYFNPAAKIDPLVGSLIPDNAHLIYWDYYKRSAKEYATMLRAHSALCDGCWYAGGVWTWDGFAPQNRYSIASISENLAACSECGTENVIITTWGDGGGECSVAAALPSLFYAAQLVGGESDPEVIKERFHLEYGIEFDSFMLIDEVTRDIDDVCYLSPSKYLLYNDPFLGILDSTVPNGCAEDYSIIADLVEPLRHNAEYGYLFEVTYRLCLAVSHKCDVGIRIRRAYREKAYDTLRALADELIHIRELVEDFYRALEKRWMRENKPHGFEVQQIRLGGLMLRLVSCAERLRGLADGRMTVIEELESEPIDVHGTSDRPYGEKRYLRYNKWHEIVTAGHISVGT